MEAIPRLDRDSDRGAICAGTVRPDCPDRPSCQKTPEQDPSAASATDGADPARQGFLS